MKKRKYLPKQDQVSPHKDGKTIYGVSNWTIVKKNFIAGIGRSAGGWFFNIVILVILANILIPIFGPRVTNFYKDLTNTVNETLSKMEINIQGFNLGQ